MPIYIFKSPRGSQLVNCNDEIDALSRFRTPDTEQIEFAPTGKIIWQATPEIPTPDHKEFIMDDLVFCWNRVANEVHQTAKDKGWWAIERNNGEIIALIHSELSEALEALRHGNPPDDKIPKFTGAAAELADVIIRIMDFDAARNFGVIEALVAKIEFNKTRELMHGGKLF